MPDSFDYSVVNSENAQLLQAIIDDAPSYTKETGSRNAEILKSIINDTEYTDAPQSEIEELLLELKEKIAGGGGDITIEELTVTENGTYSEQGKAYSPVKVELPLSSKTITENGTYTASEDNLAGYDEVTVAVQGYAKKSIENTPTAIATFNASALPMPSLKVGIEAVQSGTGDPSPTNIRPISGFSAVDVYDTNSKNLLDFAPYSGGGYNQTVGTSFNLTPSSTEVTIGTDNISYAVSGWGGLVFKTPTLKAGTYTAHADLTAITNPRISIYRMGADNKVKSVANVTGATVIYPTITVTDSDYICIWAGSSTAQTITISTPQIESGSSYTSYEKSNITTYTTTIKDSQGNPLTCYGGELSNVNGVQSLTVTHGYIASYNGETLPSTWISDRDVYAEGTTPTTGAEVVYKLATPQTIPQDNLAIATQDGTNNLWADSGDVLDGEYFKEL